MDFTKQRWICVGAGFLLGTLGLKALGSKTARKAYVQTVAAGMEARNYYQGVVEQAKAQCEDIKADATYLTEKRAEAKQDATVADAVAAAQQAAEAAKAAAEAAEQAVK